MLDLRVGLAFAHLGQGVKLAARSDQELGGAVKIDPRAAAVPRRVV